jgi:hypothetical protein
MKYKVLIINFNRLTLAKNLADWLHSKGCEPIFIDNNSDYPPLLEYYNTCPYRVVRMDKNYGHRVIWDKDIVNLLGIKDWYCVTDSDLDMSSVPDDFIDVLATGLIRYPEFNKCGLSLEINDLPDGDFVKEKCEARYWLRPLDKDYFDAQVDTTFAMYKANGYFLEGIRTNRPYTARHVPWYYKDINSLPEDEQYYFRTANDSSSGKNRIL